MQALDVIAVKAIRTERKETPCVYCTISTVAMFKTTAEYRNDRGTQVSEEVKISVKLNFQI